MRKTCDLSLTFNACQKYLTGRILVMGGWFWNMRGWYPFTDYGNISNLFSVQISIASTLNWDSWLSNISCEKSFGLTNLFGGITLFSSYWQKTSFFSIDPLLILQSKISSGNDFCNISGFITSSFPQIPNIRVLWISSFACRK